MNNFESRIKKLEEQTGVGKRERVTLFVVTGETNYKGDSRKPRKSWNKSRGAILTWRR